MNDLHLLAGLPRSGSTLLCNILNQNPELRATDTSPLPGILAGVQQAIGTSAELQGVLAEDSAATHDTIRRLMTAVIDAWYHDEDRIVFDKSRAWPALAMLIADLYPTARFVVCVRDVRAVFASIEKQHRATPWFDQSDTAITRSIAGRAGVMMSTDGLIGSSIIGALDLVARMPDRCHIVNYEALARDPGTALGELYDHCKLEPYDHDFDNVVNVTAEPDHLYLDKFPHDGSGPIRKPDRGEWTQYLTADLAAQIFATFPAYNDVFGYH